jgi:hemoglobin
VRLPATGRQPSRDIADGEDVALVVRRFYQAAIPDPLLGHLFRVGGIEWDSHIPLITSFWARELLGTPGYAGNVASAHLPVMAAPTFGSAALERWVELFCETVDEDFVGPVAERAKARAEQVAGALGTLARRVRAG